MTFAKGDECIVTCGDRTVEGRVVLMSDNQISAIVEFEAILDGHAGMMPLYARTSTDAARGIYHSLKRGTKIILSRKQ